MGTYRFTTKQVRRLAFLYKEVAGHSEEETASEYALKQAYRGIFRDAPESPDALWYRCCIQMTITKGGTIEDVRAHFKGLQAKHDALAQYHTSVSEKLEDICTNPKWEGLVDTENPRTSEEELAGMKEELEALEHLYGLWEEQELTKMSD